MKEFRVAALSTALAMLGGAAHAADLGTMPAGAPAQTSAVTVPAAMTAGGPAPCMDIVDFFTTGCQLAWYGVRFYGTIDVGLGYQTHGAPLDQRFGPGVTYFPGKMNRGAMFLASPNALSQSNAGLQIKEPLGSWFGRGWSFVGQLETAFDPYTLNLANGPGSLQDNLGKPLNAQTSSGDASTQGKFYNSLGFAGFSHDTWGTLTVGRQVTLMLDGVRAYDPMGGAYAFSYIGFFGATSGGGDTQNARGTTAIKYRINYANWHFGVFGQFGGYDAGNAAEGAIQGDIGADFHAGPGLLSLDVVGGHTKDAVSEALVGNASLFPGIPNPNSPQTSVAATISDNTNVMVLGKYTIDRLKIYAGYEWVQLAPPSDRFGCFTDIAGYVICNVAFNARDKIFQVAWVGARYAWTDTVDVVAAYYHASQNDFSAGAFATAGGVTQNCAQSSIALNSCAGSQDTVSALIDWKFAPKWDTYIGTMYTMLNGGIASGFQVHDNWATTAGVRFRW